jgi:hypothetical protein
VAYERMKPTYKRFVRNFVAPCLHVLMKVNLLLKQRNRLCLLLVSSADRAGPHNLALAVRHTANGDISKIGNVSAS